MSYKSLFDFYDFFYFHVVVNDLPFLEKTLDGFRPYAETTSYLLKGKLLFFL